ncbi:Cell wall synthesis protein KRE9 [Nakaseomyces bracarensis]|uniref:Cell wall synthesis protein KRE9 n=1 Tax=Nakaseomyces bracarensis TaxID=273131 RepID=A0ABR4NTN2_9SACH
MLLRILSVVLAFAFVRADVYIQKPGEGSQFSASGGTLSVTLNWVDNGAYPSLDKIDYYKFSICWGPNSKIQCLQSDTEVKTSSITVDDTDTYSYKFTMPSTSIANGQFYIQVFAWVDQEGFTLHYTPRFTVTGLTGPSTFLDLSYTDTTEPVPQTSIHTAGADTSTFDTSSVFSLPYTLQTLKTRVAPIQTQPGTKITATTWSRRYATSAVTFYSTFRTSLEQLSTLTPAWNYSISSDFNYATPAPMPSDNGGWYNPKQRQSLSTRKLNVKYLTN